MCVVGGSPRPDTRFVAMRIVNGKEVTLALPMRRAVDVMGSALIALERGESLQPPRTLMRLPGQGDAAWIMPGFAGDPASFGIKVLTVVPGNAGTLHHTHQGAVLLFGDHGELLALLDAAALTAIRTAAVSAVATHALAREESNLLAILGSGTQAMSHLGAMMTVRPIRQVRVWSRSADSAERFAAEAAGRFRVEVLAVPTARQAVLDADIVCTTTAARDPVLEGAWLRTGAHVNAIGSASPTDREVDGATVRRARVFVDRMECAMREAGDLLMAIAEGDVMADSFAGELGAVLVGRVEGRRTADEITLFKSVGLSAEDIAAARAVHEACDRLGIGQVVAFGA